LISAFSLFFSLLAGKINARTVRVGLRGAPVIFSYINDLYQVWSSSIRDGCQKQRLLSLADVRGG
jgi:hypothetical protein